MLQKILQEIEKKIIGYFPEKWSDKDVLFWIGEKRFKIDSEALNKNLNNPIRDFILRGGKRWRPVLFLSSLNLFGLDWKKYLDVAAALEIAHNGTLMIDDIEDRAELRRGEPTIHRIFGIDAAINAGNTMYFLPLRILEERQYKNGEQRLKILQIYSEEMINVHFGQTIDIKWHNKPTEVSVEEYLEMCRLKTGGLSRMAVRMACVLADKNEEFENSFKKFAELAGIAFQIKDDALEFEGKQKLFGKSFGNDISEGKMSLPVILALKKVSKKDKNKLLKTLKIHTKNRLLIKNAMNVIKKSGAVEESLQYAENLVDKDWKNIQPYLPKDKEEELEDFKKITYSLVKRNK